jgi:DNA polymerase III delta subunit
MMIRIKPFTNENISKIVLKIKNSENIDIEKDAEDYIINISNKTVNTVINYMEKFKILNQKITLPIAIHLSSNISFLIYEEYTKTLLNKDLHNSIKIIYKIYEKGFSLIDILDNYFIFIKTTDILNDNQKYDIIQCICKYITIFYTHDDEIELSLFTNNLIQLLNCI